LTIVRTGRYKTDRLEGDEEAIMAVTAVGAELGFQDLDAELEQTDLDVDGVLPAWLGGSLVRTGPARWDLREGSVRHWFDGLAMLHRFSFGERRVAYANRYLRSRAFEAAERDGRLAFREFATDPCRSAFKRVSTLFAPGAQLTDNGAVNVTRLGDQYLALTETPLPVAFDPQTLETLGVRGEPPADISTAHPHHDPARGELVGHGTRLGPRCTYVLYAQRDVADRRVVASIPVRRPAYQHSFCLTERHAVVFEGPFVVNPLALALADKPFIENFHWRPEQGGRFWVVDRERGGVAGPWTSEPFFCFHSVNAHEEDGDLLVDLVAYDDPSVVPALGLGRLRAGEAVPAPQLRRFRLPLGGPCAVRGEPLSDTHLELPRFDYRRCNGRPYRTVYGIGADDDRLFASGIVKVDVTTGDGDRWVQSGTFPGEPVYVPRPGARTEDDGVLLSVVLEPDRGASSLLVLDARDLSELARARVPHHIPFGFHGQHYALAPAAANGAKNGAEM
jgi:carotenoid cleavage dioxygenase-like enzyme